MHLLGVTLFYFSWRCEIAGEILFFFHLRNLAWNLHYLLYMEF